MGDETSLGGGADAIEDDLRQRHDFHVSPAAALMPSFQDTLA